MRVRKDSEKIICCLNTNARSFLLSQNKKNEFKITKVREFNIGLDATIVLEFYGVDGNPTAEKLGQKIMERFNS